MQAFHFRGSTVHATNKCLTNKTRTVTLLGKSFPMRADGRADTWTPCLKCGTPLVIDLARRTQARAKAWLLVLPRTSPEDPSWRRNPDRQDQKAHMLTAVTAAAGGRSVLDTFTGDEGDLAAAVPLSSDTASVLSALLYPFPLPARALEESGPQFAATASVFTRIVLADPALPPTTGDGLAGRGAALEQWAEDTWTVAEAVALRPAADR